MSWTLLLALAEAACPGAAVQGQVVVLHSGAACVGDACLEGRGIPLDRPICAQGLQESSEDVVVRVVLPLIDGQAGAVELDVRLSRADTQTWVTWEGGWTPEPADPVQLLPGLAVEVLADEVEETVVRWTSGGWSGLAAVPGTALTSLRPAPLPEGDPARLTRDGSVVRLPVDVEIRSPIDGAVLATVGKDSVGHSVLVVDRDLGEVELVTEGIALRGLVPVEALGGSPVEGGLEGGVVTYRIRRGPTHLLHGRLVPAGTELRTRGGEVVGRVVEAFLAPDTVDRECLNVRPENPWGDLWLCVSPEPALPFETDQIEDARRLLGKVEVWYQAATGCTAEPFTSAGPSRDRLGAALLSWSVVDPAAPVIEARVRAGHAEPMPFAVTGERAQLGDQVWWADPRVCREAASRSAR